MQSLFSCRKLKQWHRNDPVIWYFSNCNCNWGTCIVPPTRRPTAHHRVNLYLGARRQNETKCFQIMTKRVCRLQQFQLRWQPVPCSRWSSKTNMSVKIQEIWDIFLNTGMHRTIKNTGNTANAIRTGVSSWQTRSRLGCSRLRILHILHWILPTGTSVC